jgi:hypothetical protein
MREMADNVANMANMSNRKLPRRPGRSEAETEPKIIPAVIEVMNENIPTAETAVTIRERA